MKRTSIRIKELRKNRGLTQKQLAEKINVSPQVISNWERNYSSLDDEDINNLVDALETTPEYLLGRENDVKGVSDIDRLIAERIYELPEDEKQMILGLLDKFKKN